MDHRKHAQRARWRGRARNATFYIGDMRDGEVRTYMKTDRGWVMGVMGVDYASGPDVTVTRQANGEWTLG